MWSTSKERYPPNWKTEISPTVIKRDDEKCTKCGTENKVWRSEQGAVAAEKPDESGWSQIHLAAAHTCDCDPPCGNLEHLKTMCQSCHLEQDKWLHRTRAKATREHKQVESKQLTVRVAEELNARLEAESERRKVTKNDLIREAIEQYFAGKSEPHERLEELIYENAKTRAVVIRVLEMADFSISKDLLDAAAEDARAYVAGLKNGQ